MNRVPNSAVHSAFQKPKKSVNIEAEAPRYRHSLPRLSTSVEPFLDIPCVTVNCTGKVIGGTKAGGLRIRWEIDDEIGLFTDSRECLQSDSSCPKYISRVWRRQFKNNIARNRDIDPQMGKKEASWLLQRVERDGMRQPNPRLQQGGIRSRKCWTSRGRVK